MKTLSSVLEGDFSTFVNSIPDAVAIAGPDGRIVLVNAQTEAMFGYAAEELQGQSIESLMPHRFRREHPEHRKSFLERPRARPMGSGLDLYGLRKDGTEFPVEISLSPWNAAGSFLVIAAIRDMTERKKREEEIQALNRHLDAEAAYRSLVVHAPYGIYRASMEDDRFLAVNPALVQMLGYGDEEELLSLKISADVYRNPADRVVKLERARHDGRFQGVEVEWKRKDGSPVFVRLSGRRVSNQGGQQYLDVVAEDITERRKLEEQFQQSQRMEAVAGLAGGIAHDFNNLLGVIIGYSGLLLNDSGVNGFRKERVEGVLQAASSAAALTRQLLALSRKQVLQPKVLNLNTVVGDMAKMLQRVIGDDVRLRTELHADLGRAKLDRTQIEQVLLNLVINARDAMPHGGDLHIETSNAQLDDLYAQWHVGVQSGDYVMLAVMDNGQGMDKETQARVFEPFFTTKEPGKGTGLGLASVYGIVQQSGGHIWLYSEPGIGTTFKIYFPRVYDSTESVTVAPLGKSLLGHETVLVVEDHPLVRKMTCEMIRGLGYTVLEAEGPEEGLAKCHSWKGNIDLLVSDVVMPGMSGFSLREKIVEMRPSIKTLLTSGYEISKEYGALQKPFSQESLGEKMRQLLDQK
jgi:two-component system, cell cycle sensor histidine kinase and response regulator CckA